MPNHGKRKIRGLHWNRLKYLLLSIKGRDEKDQRIIERIIEDIEIKKGDGAGSIPPLKDTYYTKLVYMRDQFKNDLPI